MSLATATAAAATVAGGNIVCPADAPPNVKLAAKEIRRYVYLRTGKLLPIAADAGEIVMLSLIHISEPTRPY